jgi:NTE family protein
VPNPRSEDRPAAAAGRPAPDPGRGDAAASQPEPARARIGLAFGGGLPFGLVTLGVLRAFEAERVPVDRLAGTSMGSILSAMYAAGLPIDECIERLRRAFDRKHLLAALLRDLSFSGRGLLRGSEVVHMLESFIGTRRFEDLKIPLRIPACDLVEGTEVVFETGPLVPAIRASISMPGILEPFHYQGRVLVDGALIRPIPVHLLHDDEVELKIPVRAVRCRSRQQLHEDVHAARSQHRKHLLSRPGGGVFSVLWRTMSLIMQDEFAEMVFDDFDVYIKPQLDLDLSRDPSRLDEIVAEGYAEAMRRMPAIHKAIADVANQKTRSRQASETHDPLADAMEAELED